MDNRKLNLGPMLNAYPDSMGGTLGDIVSVLKKNELKDAFSSFYILPSIFNTDLDRGFSVIDYGIDRAMASREDLDALQGMNIDLKLDFILNHASVLSPQFQDLLKNGEKSEYRDFFIDWNKFWEGHG
ncbi:MAG: glycosidase, partial [Oscillospiraceae bacterium]|nr:glycosidase [Oscillospiraceae bacterium]